MFKDLVIRRDDTHSYPEYRQIMLSAELAVVGIAVCSMLALLELSRGQLLPTYFFVTEILILASAIYWHRVRRHVIANSVLLIPVAILTYLIASSEAFDTGAFVHFTSVALAGFIVFGFQRKKLAIGFSLFVAALFLVFYFVPYSVLPTRVYTPEDVTLFRLLNFGTAAATCLVGVFLLMRMNHYNAMNLLESQKTLSKSNAELDRFVYSTSHDLRAPLTSILGLINLAGMNPNEEEKQRYLELMKDRVHILDKFIKDITDYSRNSRLAVERETVNVATLGNEVWEMLRYTPDATGVEFKLDVPTNEMVQTDPARLKTVLLNLLSNAVRYHDPAKDDRFIRLGFHRNGKGFHLQVEDNGQGIDPNAHSKVFDMFYRASNKANGSGLGLYIVKETVTKLAGSIQLESNPGIGSTFTVKLPYELTPVKT